MKDGCVVTLGDPETNGIHRPYYPARGVGPFAWTENEEHYTYTSNPDGTIPYKMKSPDLRTFKYFIDLRMYKDIAECRARDTPIVVLCNECCAVQCCQCRL